MARKLFCEISPTAYQISTLKEIALRNCKDKLSGISFAYFSQTKPLPILAHSHRSLIRRKLGNVDLSLQENKAVNLSIAAPLVSGIIIRPGEVFSFWKLVGNCTEAKGYKKGLVIKGSKPDSDIGGGMCQFTNLIHWLVLHSPLDIAEHHHHNGVDLFPDYNRQVPFGVGTSIVYNYLDYRFKNNTKQAFQLIIYLTDEYLCGELRCEKPLDYSYHIAVKEEYFTHEKDGYYRNNIIYRNIIDKNSGNNISSELLLKNHAKIMYSPDFIPTNNLREL